MPSQPKRHHYLPESYLCRFTHGGTPSSELWVYDIEKREFRSQTPHGTGVQRHYYSVTLPNGTKDARLETEFSEVEGCAISIIKKVEARQDLTNEERSALAYFLALLKVRVPQFEDTFNQSQEQLFRMATRMLLDNDRRAQEAIDQFQKETGKTISMSGKEMAEFASDPTRCRFVLDRRHSLILSLKMADALAPDFHRMEWTFVHSPNNTSFLTTDAPYTITPPPNAGKGPTAMGYGYKHIGTKKIMPLSAKTAVVMGDPGSDTIHCDLDDNGVFSINCGLASDAFRYVIGRDEANLRSVVEEVLRLEKLSGSKWGGSRLIFG
jgi:hypothetical protein